MDIEEVNQMILKSKSHININNILHFNFIFTEVDIDSDLQCQV